jgi:hypothetical protein
VIKQHFFQNILSQHTPLPILDNNAYISLQNIAMEGKKQHGRSQKTTGAYDGYICCGNDFLGQFSDDAKNKLDVPLSGEDEDGSWSLSEAKMDIPNSIHARI